MFNLLMKNKTVFILFLITIILGTFINNIIQDLTNSKSECSREGFASSQQTYLECINNGYTKEFCSQNNLPSTCLCPDGTIGKILPGFQGKCVCGSMNSSDIFTFDTKEITEKINNGSLATDTVSNTREVNEDFRYYSF